MKKETLEPLTYQECTTMHRLMNSSPSCTVEALRQSYHRLFMLFDLLSQITSDEHAEKLIVFIYNQTFKRREKEDG